jgi:LemA protein
MKKVLAILAILVLIVLILGAGGCSTYRHIVTLDEAAQAQWAQIDNQLQRRYELIPNLVNTVKGYAAHEKEILETVAHARERYFSAKGDDERVQASAGVERALSRLLMLQETYPTLKADESFLKLQDQLEGTENRIAVERGRYNDAARELNTYIRTPGGMLGNMLAQVKPRTYFEVTEGAREAPKVQF